MSCGLGHRCSSDLALLRRGKSHEDVALKRTQTKKKQKKEREAKKKKKKKKKKGRKERKRKKWSKELTLKKDDF